MVAKARKGRFQVPLHSIHRNVERPGCFEIAHVLKIHHLEGLTVAFVQAVERQHQYALFFLVEHHLHGLSCRFFNLGRKRLHAVFNPLQVVQAGIACGRKEVVFLRASYFVCGPLFPYPDKQLLHNILSILAVAHIGKSRRTQRLVIAPEQRFEIIGY